MLNEENNMQSKAVIKYVKISPRKLRYLVDELKTLKPGQAVDRLSLSRSRSAFFLMKAIKSAIDNGRMTQNMIPEKMEFESLSIDEGIVLKRFRAGAKGMGKPYKRRTSHINVVITQKEPAIKTVAKVNKGPEAVKKTQVEDKSVANKDEVTKKVDKNGTKS